MSSPRTIRGKLVKQHGILIDVHQNGDVHISFEGPAQRVDMLEEQAIAFFEMLGNVISWSSE